MRLCLDSFVPPLDRITLGTATWVRDLGFHVIGVDLESLIETDEAGCRAIRDLLAGEGVGIGQVWSVGTPLVRSDPGEMTHSITTVLERIPLAAALGCSVLLVETGGYHPVNPWYPHPQNHTDSALEALIAQLRRVTPLAADYGVFIAPEMSLMGILSSPDRAEAMLEGVGDQGVGINYDPVNITEPRWLYRTGPQIRDMFERLGDRIVNAHAKDVVAKDVPLVVHLDEVPAGQGVMEYDVFLECLCRLPPWTCLVIEHLTDYGQVAEVKRFLEDTAHKVGVAWD